MIAAALLGPPAIAIDEAPAPAELLWRKHLAVCLVLWSTPGMRVSRETLISLLWADKDDASARHSLNEALRIIRRHAGADALESEDDAVRWLAPIALDLADFAAAEGVNPEAAAGLIRGSFCEGFGIAEAPAFEEWLTRQRDLWAPRLVEATLGAAAHAEQSGHIDRSLQHALQASVLAPYRDEAARALIRARWLTGDRAGALADGRHFAQRMGADRRAQPDPTTKALIARVAAGRAPRVHASDAATPRRPPFFGRYQILSRTLAITRTVISERRPALIVLSGESGSGRSRLLDEIVLRATLEGEVVTTMRAVDPDHDAPLALWLGLASGGLLDAPGVMMAPTAVLAGVAAVSHEWAERFPVTRGATGLPLSDSVTGIVRAAADRTPLMLAIDDAHRLGERGLQRILKLLRDMAGMPVIILVTLDTGVPSGAADDLRRAAEREMPGTSMRIDRWDLGDLDQLVGWALPGWDDQDRHRLARRLTAESEGRPAIAVELLAAVADGLPLDIDTGTWAVPTAGQPVRLASEPLAAAIRLAFARLPEPARVLLGAAALLPEPTTVPRLAQIADIAEGSPVEGLLDRLEWERWLVADGRGYSFPARVIRQLIGNEILSATDRARFDARIAAPRP